MSELKTCPFCGARMNFDSRGMLFAWHKPGCFLQLLVTGMIDVMAGKNRDAMVEAWNRREGQDDVTDVVRCCECAYHDDESLYHYCHKWNRNCPDDSDFFCKWGKRKNGGQDE